MREHASRGGAAMTSGPSTSLELPIPRARFWRPTRIAVASRCGPLGRARGRDRSSGRPQPQRAHATSAHAITGLAAGRSADERQGRGRSARGRRARSDESAAASRRPPVLTVRRPALLPPRYAAEWLALYRPTTTPVSVSALVFLVGRCGVVLPERKHERQAECVDGRSGSGSADLRSVEALERDLFRTRIAERP